KEYKNKWIISNYSKINHIICGELISPSFGYTRDSFEIRFNRFHTNYYLREISIYLHSTAEQNDIEFSLTLLNKDPKKNFCRKYNGEGFTSIWGWSNFICADEINKENGFVTEDDKVEFEFTLTYPKAMPLLSNYIPN
ncbi:hypothetical protein DICPUDRAFT_85646, partial [Dictyostelium purpureum]